MQGLARLLKWLIGLAAVGAVLLGISYVGARATAGKLLGSEPPFSGREVELAWKGTPDLSGSPRAWVITYHASRLPGVRSAKIYVSLTGELIATSPRDLDVRLDAWERAKEP